MLTRYEVTRIVSARALQIAMGAPVLLRLSKDVSDPIKIAKLEFLKGACPITVKRRLPINLATKEEKFALIDGKAALKNWIEMHGLG
jgi:DNA-directed RNA polymerase subunit K